MHACMHTYIHTYIHTYMHACIRTYIHRYMHDHQQNPGRDLCQRPYHVEYTASRPISEVKQRWVWLVLGWVTAWEYQMLLAFCHFYRCHKIFIIVTKSYVVLVLVAVAVAGVAPPSTSHASGRGRAGIRPPCLRGGWR